MNNFEKAARYTAAGVLSLAATGLGGAAVGKVLDMIPGNHSVEYVEGYQTDYDIAAEWAVGVDDNLAKVEQGIGETCLVAIQPYVTGNLVGTSEDSAVQDILIKPNQACGDDATIIRGHIVELEAATEADTEARYSLEFRAEELRSAKKIANKDREFTGWRWGLKWFMLIGSVPAVAASAVWSKNEIELVEAYRDR